MLEKKEATLLLLSLTYPSRDIVIPTTTFDIEFSFFWVLLFDQEKPNNCFHKNYVDNLFGDVFKMGIVS
jgi:hypothetical protein